MGREIRRVLPNWEHPMTPCEHSPWKGGCDTSHKHGGKCFKPLFDRSFSEAVRDWKEGFMAWERGERPEYCDDEKSRHLEFWEWDGAPPTREDYRPEWTEAEATWFQVYETVSEGTPVTPAFATKAELIVYLMEHGDYWDQMRGNKGYTRAQAEAFVKDEFVPSLMVTDGKIYQGIEISSAPR